MCATMWAVGAWECGEGGASVDDEVERLGRVADAHLSREVTKSVEVALKLQASGAQPALMPRGNTAAVRIDGYKAEAGYGVGVKGRVRRR